MVLNRTALYIAGWLGLALYAVRNEVRHLTNRAATSTGSKSSIEANMERIMKVSLYPENVRKDRDDVENPELEYQQRLDRVKQVCKKYTDSGWYNEHVLPLEYKTLEDWIMDHGLSNEKLERMDAHRDDHKNLQMGGMPWNELKLQVDKKHNIIYCDLPKCGSSVWQKQMMKLDVGLEEAKRGNIHKSTMDENKFLYSYHPDEQIRRLKEDYKFMFVRHPFERLLSAYRDKVSRITDLSFEDVIWERIVKGNELEERLFGHIRKDIDLSQYKAALQAFDIVGFHTFVTYLVNRGPDDDWIKDRHGYIGSMWETRQKHWRPYVDICKICSIDWDFIGKTEHFEQDHNYMFEKLGILDEVGGPMVGERNAYGANKFFQYYTGLPKSTLEKLYKFYQIDFELFGYEVPDRLWEMAEDV